MKALKIIGIILGILIVIFVIAMFALPTDIHVERTTSIDAPVEVVWENVNSLKDMHEWSPWMEMDPDAVVTFEGPEGQVGEKNTWEGNDDVGKGEQEITAIEPMKRVKTKIHFLEPWESEADAWVTLEPEGEGTKVSWGFDSEMSRPWNVFMPFMNMKGAIEKDFDKGLSKLKEKSENDKNSESAVASYDIKTEEMPAGKYLTYRQEVAMADLKDFFDTEMSAIGELVASQGMEMTGAPSAIYYTWDTVNARSDMALAIPVKASKGQLGKYKILDVPEGKALVIDYYGPYEDMGPAHMAIDDFMESNGLGETKMVMEQYITDPMNEPDTAKWHSRIIYYLTEK